MKFFEQNIKPLFQTQRNLKKNIADKSLLVKSEFFNRTVNYLTIPDYFKADVLLNNLNSKASATPATPTTPATPLTDSTISYYLNSGKLPANKSLDLLCFISVDRFGNSGDIIINVEDKDSIIGGNYSSVITEDSSMFIPFKITTDFKNIKPDSVINFNFILGNKIITRTFTFDTGSGSGSGKPGKHDLLSVSSFVINNFNSGINPDNFDCNLSVKASATGITSPFNISGGQWNITYLGSLNQYTIILTDNTGCVINAIVPVINCGFSVTLLPPYVSYPDPIPYFVPVDTSLIISGSITI